MVDKDTDIVVAMEEKENAPKGIVTAMKCEPKWENTLSFAATKRLYSQ